MDAISIVSAYERLVGLGLINPLPRRDQFAMAAMTGLLASQRPGCTWGTAIATVKALEYADALIAALDRAGGGKP